MNRTSEAEKVSNGGAPSRRQLFSAIDYVQMACLGGRSVQVTCYRDDERRGEITIREGVIWSASDRYGVGRGAFCRIVTSPCADIDPPPTPLPPATIDEPWEALLLDALREEDELEHYEGHGTGTFAKPKRRASEFPPASADGLSLPFPVPGRLPKMDEIEEISWQLDVAAHAVAEHDYETAAAAYRRVLELRPHHALARCNLSRIEALG